MHENTRHVIAIGIGMGVPLLAAAAVPALILAAAAVPALMAASFLAIAMAEPGPHELAGNLGTFALVLVVASYYAGAHAFTLGIAACLLGWRLRFINLWSCMITGFLIGAAPVQIISLLTNEGSYSPADMMLWGLFGLAGGFGFWLVW